MTPNTAPRAAKDWTLGQLALAWLSLLAGRAVVKTLHLLDWLGLPMPDRGIRLAARLTIPTVRRLAETRPRRRDAR